MSRTIKFRAWDKENNQWYEPIFEGYKGNIYELMLSMSGDLCIRTIDQMMHQSLFPERFGLMQWTGLVDKHGVEIFEGDIVNQFDLDVKREVVFLDGSSGYYDSDDDYKQFISFSQNKWYEWNHGRSVHIEVIGNKYSNPELLR